jgi:hypothetical protein
MFQRNGRPPFSGSKCFFLIVLILFVDKVLYPEGDIMESYAFLTILLMEAFKRHLQYLDILFIVHLFWM